MNDEQELEAEEALAQAEADTLVEDEDEAAPAVAQDDLVRVASDLRNHLKGLWESESELLESAREGVFAELAELALAASLEGDEDGLRRCVNAAQAVLGRHRHRTRGATRAAVMAAFTAAVRPLFRPA